MSRLFIHPYLDEDVDVLIATIIRARGFDVTTARDAAMLRRNDADQLAFAADHGMAVVTHNRGHFEVLAKEYCAHSKSHAGIILAVRRPYAEVARRLIDLLNSIAADEMENQTYYI